MTNSKASAVAQEPSQAGFNIVCKVCNGLGIVFDCGEDAPSSTQISAGIAALRVERSVISETSRSQGNQISLRSDADAVLSYNRTNGIWKLPLNVWPYRCKTAQSPTRFFARFPCLDLRWR